MRVEVWNPNKMDQTFENIAVGRLEEAANVVAGAVRRWCPEGTRSRPIYRTGPYAGMSWTARDRGMLKRSIRVVRQRTRSGKALSRKRNVRVYAGHYFAYYANIVEYYTPFMRPGLDESLGAVKQIIGAK